jgi:hypothetical protein
MTTFSSVVTTHIGRCNTRIPTIRLLALRVTPTIKRRCVGHVVRSSKSLDLILSSRSQMPKRFSSSNNNTNVLEESSASSSSSVPAAAPQRPADNVLLSGSASESLGTIVRHGPGDACIVLNVGGTEFMTLRSTVAANPVLADHVARAEANQEIMLMKHGGGGESNAVFIDRDSKHFGLILQYLRNQVELETSGLPSSSSSNDTLSRLIGSWRTQSFMPTLPKDPNMLAELYVEVTYYRLTELQNALHDQSAWTRLVSLLGFSKVGGLYGNPIVRASQVLARLRVFLMTVGAAVGTTVGMQQTGTKQMKQLWEFCGLKTKDDDDETEEEDENESSFDVVEGLLKALPLSASEE